MIEIRKAVLLIVAFGFILSAGATVHAQTLERVKARGSLQTGIDTKDNKLNVFKDGKWVGFDVDFYKAISVAVLGSADGCKIEPTSDDQVLVSITSGEFNIVMSDRIAKDTKGVVFGSPILITDGKTRVPVLLGGDEKWQRVVSLAIQAIVSAEQYKLTKANVKTASEEDPTAKPFFDQADKLGAELKLPKGWAVRVISEVGNYGEIFKRHMGAADRGQNKAKSAGGSLEGFLNFSGSVSTREWKPVGSELVGGSFDVSADGSRVAVRMNYGGERGNFAQIFGWDGTAWKKVGAGIRVRGDGGTSQSGTSLSADGTRVAIQCNEFVEVYSWDGKSWNQVGAEIKGKAGETSELDYKKFLRSVSVIGNALDLSPDGTVLAVGTIDNVRVLKWNGNSWKQVGTDIKGFGVSVSLSDNGRVVAVGAKGHVRVYGWNGTSWKQVGSGVKESQPDSRLGETVSLSGSGRRLVVSELQPNNSGGQVRIYDWNGASWQLVGSPIDNASSGSSSFGFSVSLSNDGKRLAVGDTQPAGDGPGYVQVFDWNGSKWDKVASAITVEHGETKFGFQRKFGYHLRLSADANVVAIAGYYLRGVRICKVFNLSPLMPARSVQTRIAASEDFESLTGKLNGQGRWKTTRGSPLVSPTDPKGSLDGQFFRSVDHVGGFAYRPDEFKYIAESDTQVTISFSGRMGGGHWSRLGVGYFDGSEYSNGVMFGPNGKERSWFVNDQSSKDLFPGKAAIYDLRLIIDLVNKTGTLEVENSEDARIHWFTPEGMSNFSIANLDNNATDGNNPRNWNSLYIRSIARGDTIDNISVTTARPAAVTEDFESLASGNLNGQGRWKTTSGSPLVSSTDPKGSLDGNFFKADDRNGGIAYRHDGINYIAETDTHVTFSFSGRVGGGHWSRVGVGCFDGTEYSNGVIFGSNGKDHSWSVGNASSKDRFPSKATIYDLRLTVDLTNKTGTLEVENSEEAGINWFTPDGLSNFSLAKLDMTATDGNNPRNWNSLYIRSIGQGDSIDNISVVANGPTAAVPVIAESGGENSRLIGHWMPNLEETEKLHDKLDPDLREVLSIVAMEFSTGGITLLVHDEPATLSINNERVTPNESYTLKKTNEADVFQLVLTDEKGVEHLDKVKFLSEEQVMLTLGKGGPPVVLDRVPEPGYAIEVVSGDGQTYAGGVMPEAMTIRIKDRSGHYLSNLKDAGLTIEVSSHEPGKVDPAFGVAENKDKTCFSGKFLVPPLNNENANGEPYNLRVKVQIKQADNVVASHTFVQHIRVDGNR